MLLYIFLVKQYFFFFTANGACMTEWCCRHPLIGGYLHSSFCSSKQILFISTRWILWSKEAELIKVETCASTEYVKMEMRENDFIISNIQDRLNRILMELNELSCMENPRMKLTHSHIIYCAVLESYFPWLTNIFM